MKQQLVGLLKVLLFMFCIIVVLWQVFMGTKKYLEAPVANKIFAEEVELPDITVCHLKTEEKLESCEQVRTLMTTRMEGCFQRRITIFQWRKCLKRL